MSFDNSNFGSKTCNCNLTELSVLSFLRSSWEDFGRPEVSLLAGQETLSAVLFGRPDAAVVVPHGRSLEDSLGDFERRDLLVLAEHGALEVLSNVSECADFAVVVAHGRSLEDCLGDFMRCGTVLDVHGTAVETLSTVSGRPDVAVVVTHGRSLEDCLGDFMRCGTVLDVHGTAVETLSTVSGRPDVAVVALETPLGVCFEDFKGPGDSVGVAQESSLDT